MRHFRQTPTGLLVCQDCLSSAKWQQLQLRASTTGSPICTGGQGILLIDHVGSLITMAHVLGPSFVRVLPNTACMLQYGANCRPLPHSLLSIGSPEKML